MRKCAFTIVAKNYIGLAKLLGKSIKATTPDVDFYIFTADEIGSYQDLKGEKILEARLVLHQYTNTEWVNMSFKYNLTEFCTAIKPYCFKYLFEDMKYDKAMYFDPDIYVYSSLKQLYNQLDAYSIIVTPHILYPCMEEDKERNLLQSGIYNLGYLGLKNNETSLRFINWWGQKLKNYCFDELLEYTFTDQKWVTLITIFFPQEEILVSRNLGLNVAPWNFYERKFIEENGKIRVVCRNNEAISDDLVFVHYSGYNYLSVLEGKIERPRVLEEQVDYPDVDMMMDKYTAAMKTDEQSIRMYLNLPYTYAFYDNNVKIEKFHRRIYHKISKADDYSKINPFTSDKESLYSKFKNLGMISSAQRKSPENVDMSNEHAGRLLYSFNMLMKIVFKLMGYKRYLMLLRLLKHYCRYESQVFIIDNNYMKSNIDIPTKKTL